MEGRKDRGGERDREDSECVRSVIVTHVEPLQ